RAQDRGGFVRQHRGRDRVLEPLQGQDRLAHGLLRRHPGAGADALGGGLLVLRHGVGGDMETLTWNDCYSRNWNGIIIPAAMGHPAKMARGLLCRILDFGLAEGFWKKGSLVLDPLAGVGTTGIECANRGIRFIGVELEGRFFRWAEANFALQRRTWEQFGDPLPVILQGDSRRLAAALREAGAVVASPPYAESRVTSAGAGGVHNPPP